jgi:hypothetical protein
MVARNNTPAAQENSGGTDAQAALERNFLVVNDERIESTPDPLEEIKKILGKASYGT